MAASGLRPAKARAATELALKEPPDAQRQSQPSISAVSSAGQDLTAARSISSSVTDSEAGRGAPTGSPLVAHQARLLPVPVALGRVGPLVVQLLALGQGKPQLGAAARIEIQLQRHHRHALALDGDGKLGDLALVQQQAARPFRLMLEKMARTLVLGDVGVDQEDAVVLH